MGCFRSQRYKNLKAIHNSPAAAAVVKLVVLEVKDTKIWKQFTTNAIFDNVKVKLF